jgi:hypothetical protein
VEGLIGYLLICLAITLLFVFVLGYDLELKEKIMITIGIMVFMALLVGGAYLLV